MTEYVAGIDIGTGKIMVMICGLDGQIISSASREYYNWFSPRINWIDMKPSILWEILGTVSKEAIIKAKMNPRQIAGLSLSSCRSTLIIVDKQGRPIRKGILWADRRTKEQCEWLKHQIGEDYIFEITGLPVHPNFTLPKILWLKENEPMVFKEAHKFILIQDFITRLLGARDFFLDHSNASSTLVLDVNTLDWSDYLLDFTGIPRKKLSKLVTSGTLLGYVSKEASIHTGFAEGTPIIAGGGDQQCAGLGAGIIDSGLAEITIGSAAIVLCYAENPYKDERKSLTCNAHVVPRKWEIEGMNFSSGSVYRWFKNNFWREAERKSKEGSVIPYEILEKQITKVPVGSRGVLVLPHFSGRGTPDWNTEARGLFIGLTLDHTKADLTRAIMEGITLDVKTALDAMESLVGKIEKIRITGGATKSRVWTQMQADIYGKPIYKLRVKDCSCLGAAIIAGAGTQKFKSLEKGVMKMVKVTKKVEPIKENHRMYSEILRVYKKVCDTLGKEGVYHSLFKLTESLPES